MKHFLYLVESCIRPIHHFTDVLETFLMLIQHIFIFKQLVTVLSKLDAVRLEGFLVAPLRSDKLFFVFIDFFGESVVALS